MTKTKPTQPRKPVAHLCVCGDHAWTPLTRGYVTLVDPDDADLLAAYCWEAKVEPNGRVSVVLAASEGVNGVVYLSRVVANRRRLKPSQQAPERRQ
jgi:hypothetical protein